MQLISKTNIDFMGKRRITAVLSFILIVTGIFSLFTRGLNLGVDFTGGVLLEISYEQPADLTDIRFRLDGGGFGEALVQNFGTATDVLIRVLPAEGVDSAQ